MNTIQEVSEKILLAFYKIYRNEGLVSEDTISFEKSDEWEVTSDDEKLISIMLSIADNSALSLKSSIKYLHDKKLINFSTLGRLSDVYEIYGIEVTAQGIDIIEGVTGAHTSKIIYQNTFNVKLADNINLESLISTKLAPEFKLFGL